jgi:hypothetical protein
MSIGYSNTWVLNLMRQAATSIIVGWFEAHTRRNNNKWYIQPFKLLCNFIVYTREIQMKTLKVQ